MTNIAVDTEVYIIGKDLNNPDIYRGVLTEYDTILGKNLRGFATKTETGEYGLYRTDIIIPVDEITPFEKVMYNIDMCEK